MFTAQTNFLFTSFIKMCQSAQKSKKFPPSLQAAIAQLTLYYITSLKIAMVERMTNTQTVFSIRAIKET